MTKLPKGSLKVIHVNRKAIGENEERARATMGTPRRLVPTFTIWSLKGKKTVKHEAFGFRVIGEVRGAYDITRFPPGYQYGTPDVRVWLETTDAVELADEPGELNQPEQAAPTQD